MDHKLLYDVTGAGGVAPVLADALVLLHGHQQSPIEIYSDTLSAESSDSRVSEDSRFAADGMPHPQGDDYQLTQAFWAGSPPKFTWRGTSFYEKVG